VRYIQKIVVGFVDHENPSNELINQAKLFGFDLLEKFLEIDADRFSIGIPEFPWKNYFQKPAAERSDCFDRTLMADKKKVPIHKAMVSARSDYFKAMFHTYFQEKDQKIIELQFSGATLVSIIEYIYTDQLRENISWEITIAAELLSKTHMILMTRQKDLIQRILAEKITVENSLFLLPVAQETEAKFLEESCLYCCCKNLEELKNKFDLDEQVEMMIVHERNERKWPTNEEIDIYLKYMRLINQNQHEGKHKKMKNVLFNECVWV